MEMVDSIGASGGLGIMWKKNLVAFTCHTKMQNWMAGKVRALSLNIEFFIINVYGPIPTDKKRLVWQEIECFLNNQDEKHIIIGGDFNTILYSTDKSGGIKTIRQPQRDFANWINNNNLLEIRTEMGFHTWNNRRKGFSNIAETLDRLFLKGDLTDLKTELKTTVFLWSGYDHYSMLLELMGEAKKTGCPFKFEMMWFTHEDFLRNIQKWWKDSVFEGSKMYCLVSKLKEIKHKLLEWNKKKFKNIFEEKSRIEKEMETMNNIVMQYGMTLETYEAEKKLLCEYKGILAREEIHWKHKSRETWLEDGDKNTKFFHNNVKMKREVNKITQIINDSDQIITYQNLIAEDATKYFENILNNWDHSDLPNNRILLNNIPKLITKGDNQVLNYKITHEEVKTALAQFQGDKAPGLNGFPAGFLQKCWHMLGDEVTNALESA
ncbi:uncharacterized protein LOC131078305 [Cryptomeria japonica]|uniref:uncharacterized protein LOC131078305 n=1 Tax=Cryptomeria japonica TaxID=3369 RepID=UPI0025AD69B0|nr:uncharacterized protein LOC131078305 [Cryptomeria japonica]